MPTSNRTLDLFDLSGRRAVVTGAGGLLGREFCGALADAGATVIAVDRDHATASIACDRAEIHPLVCDVTNPEMVASAITTIAAGGKIDALVTSAGIDPKVDTEGQVSGGAVPFIHYPAHAWAESIDVNLTGTFLVAQAVASVMEHQADGRGAGSIVTIASTYGLAGPDQRIYADATGRQRSFKPLDYATTKAGVLGFTRALAAYYQGTAIRVNALTPGGAFNGQDPAFVERYSARTILGRMADPAEYRAALVFLCSDASSYMTGSNLVIDGGWTAW